jgi:short-subunit dehydrogenase
MNLDRIILITGTSSGIGKSCAEYLSKKGFIVVGTSRIASFPPENIRGNSPIMIKMDNNDDKSIKNTIDYIIKEFGRIDVLVNNAGYGIGGAIEESSIQKVKEQFETNFFGTLRMCKSILPLMRKQKNGYIINISSIGGIIGLPYQGIYSASKFAIEGMTEALRMEVRPFGIKIVLIEPGDLKTSFTSRREKIIDSSEKSVYKKNANLTLNIVEKDEQGGGSPIKVAYLIEKIINKSNPKTRYKVGSFTQKLAASLKGKIPDRSLEWILRKYYKVP